LEEGESEDSCVPLRRQFDSGVVLFCWLEGLQVGSKHSGSNVRGDDYADWMGNEERRATAGGWLHNAGRFITPQVRLVAQIGGGG
jgi:hypothetical protein